MYKIKTLKNKRKPKGWDLVEPVLNEMAHQMREAESETQQGKRKVESTWRIWQLHHQRSRYVYELFYKKKEISRELYDYCLNEKWADKALIAKWKKTGYERLCCLLCIQNKDHNFQTACVCRVPKQKLENSTHVECVACGCKGCASGD